VPRIVEGESGQPGAIAGTAKQRIDRLPSDAEHQHVVPSAHRRDQAQRARLQRHQARAGFRGYSENRVENVLCNAATDRK
jgi:hypothetical protein